MIKAVTVVVVTVVVVVIAAAAAVVVVVVVAAAAVAVIESNDQKLIPSISIHIPYILRPGLRLPRDPASSLVVLNYYIVFSYRVPR